MTLRAFWLFVLLAPACYGQAPPPIVLDADSATPRLVVVISGGRAYRVTTVPIDGVLPTPVPPPIPIPVPIPDPVPIPIPDPLPPPPTPNPPIPPKPDPTNGYSGPLALIIVGDPMDKATADFATGLPLRSILPQWQLSAFRYYRSTEADVDALGLRDSVKVLGTPVAYLRDANGVVRKVVKPTIENIEAGIKSVREGR